MDLFNINFCMSKLIIQCNTDSCYVHVTGSVNIYLYMCVRLLVLLCPVCVISNQSTSKNHVYSCQTFTKFDSLLHKTQQGAATTKIPNLDKSRSITSLRKKH